MFTLSVIVSFFWIFVNSINVYGNAFVGFVFEILWLPMLVGIFFIAVVSIILVFKKNTRKLLPILSIIILTAILFYLMQFK